jgi:hypothetical protein
VQDYTSSSNGSKSSRGTSAWRSPDRSARDVPTWLHAPRAGEFSNAATLLDGTLRFGWIATFMVPQCRVAGDYDGALRFGHEALTSSGPHAQGNLSAVRCP